MRTIHDNRKLVNCPLFLIIMKTPLTEPLFSKHTGDHPLAPCTRMTQLWRLITIFIPLGITLCRPWSLFNVTTLEVVAYHVTYGQNLVADQTQYTYFGKFDTCHFEIGAIIQITWYFCNSGPRDPYSTPVQDRFWRGSVVNHTLQDGRQYRRGSYTYW